MKVQTFDELLPLYVRARQKIRNQRNELRALNKSIKWEQANRSLAYNDIERFRRLWDDERKRKMPPPAKKEDSKIMVAFILAMLFVGIVGGFLLGRHF